MKYEYAASETGILSDAQALVVGRELTKIEKAKGCIVPKSVWQAARKSTSPMHPYFTWDVQKAAERRWDDEARSLIRSVIIIPVERKTENVKAVRAFVSVHSTENETKFKGKGYISMPRAVNDEGYKQQVLQDALNEVNSWRLRYDNLKEFLGGIFDEIDAVVERVKEPA